MKADIDGRELLACADRIALKRRKEAYENETLVDCMVARTLDGASCHDLAVETVTREEVLAAARTVHAFLPPGVRAPRVEGAVGAGPAARSARLRSAETQKGPLESGPLRYELLKMRKAAFAAFRLRAYC